jgi:hypothetical protein
MCRYVCRVVYREHGEAHRRKTDAVELALGAGGGEAHLYIDLNSTGCREDSEFFELGRFAQTAGQSGGHQFPGDALSLMFFADKEKSKVVAIADSQNAGQRAADARAEDEEALGVVVCGEPLGRAVVVKLFTSFRWVAGRDEAVEDRPEQGGDFWLLARVHGRDRQPDKIGNQERASFSDNA